MNKKQIEKNHVTEYNKHGYHWKGNLLVFTYSHLMPPPSVDNDGSHSYRDCVGVIEKYINKKVLNGQTLLTMPDYVYLLEE